MEERIADLLDIKFKEEEFADCFWLDIKVLPNKKLEIFLDSDSGITFEKCRKVSRYLEAFIDEENWLGEKYTLEVSSAGITRPLQLLRQYHRNVGRKVEVKMKDGEKHEGNLVEVEGSQIKLEAKVRRKEGKRKVTELVQTVLDFDQIASTKVKISFKK